MSQGVLTAFLGIGNNVIMIWQGQTSLQTGGQRAGKRIHFKYEDLQAIRDEAPLVRLVSAENIHGARHILESGEMHFSSARS